MMKQGVHQCFQLIWLMRALLSLLLLMFIFIVICFVAFLGLFVITYINYAPFTSFQRLFNDVSIHTNAILYSCILCILQSNQKIKITTHRSVTISLFLSRRFFTFSDIKSRFRRSSCKSFTSSSVTSSLFLQ
jgi:hypothetical protein